MGPVELSIYGQATHNYGADGEPGEGQSYSPTNDVLTDMDPSTNNDAYVVGVEAKIDKVKLGYKFVKVESDALFNPVKDADYQIGDSAVDLAKSDLHGHVMQASYNVTNNMSINGTVYLLDREDQENPQYKALNHYRLDFLYKF